MFISILYCFEYIRTYFGLSSAFMIIVFIFSLSVISAISFEVNSSFLYVTVSFKVVFLLLLFSSTTCWICCKCCCCLIASLFWTLELVASLLVALQLVASLLVASQLVASLLVASLLVASLLVASASVALEAKLYK